MIEKLLLKVKEIEGELELLKNEKEELRQQIIVVMNEKQSDKEIVDLPIGKFKIAKRCITTVTYEQDVLKERLGDKIKLVLDLDTHKMRSHKAMVVEALGDKLIDVGKISQTKVKQAVASGELSLSDFKDAFEKKTVDRITISKVRDESSVPSADAPY